MQKEKVRVYQLARELNVDTKILLDLCKQSGFDVKNQLSNLEPEQRDALEQMIKRGSQAAAKPAAPARPVTPVVAPDQRAVPNLGRSRPRRSRRDRSRPPVRRARRPPNRRSRHQRSPQSCQPPRPRRRRRRPRRRCRRSRSACRRCRRGRVAVCRRCQVVRRDRPPFPRRRHVPPRSSRRRRLPPGRLAQSSPPRRACRRPPRRRRISRGTSGDAAGGLGWRGASDRA